MPAMTLRRAIRAALLLSAAAATPVFAAPRDDAAASPASATAPGADAAVVAPASVEAAPAAEAAENDASTVLTLGRVRSQARAVGPLSVNRVFSSVDVLAGEVFEQRSVDYSWELFTQAPGVQVTRFGTGVESGRISFRGFNGEGRINAVKLLIDGIPGNDSNGATTFLDAVLPLDIEAVEVVRGTNDARNGLNAIAGSVNVITRQGGNDGLAAITVGSFGTREVQVAKGFEDGAWSQNYFLGWRDSEGYRDHGRALRRNFAARWFYTDPDGAWRAGLSTRYVENDAEEVGFLPTYAQAQATPRASAPWHADDESARRLVMTALIADGQLGEDWAWSARAYDTRHDNLRYIRFTQAGFQQERVTDETHRGVIATTTWRPEVARFEEVALEAGVDAQWQDNVSQRYRTVVRERVLPLRAWDWDFDTRGAYVQAVLRPVERLRLVPGYRIDRIDGGFLDVLGGLRYPVHDYGTIEQPKFSAAWTLSDAATLYANWGRTFQVGAGNGAFRTTSARLGPSVNEGWEAGLSLRPADWIDGRVALWEQKASGEVARVIGVGGSVGTGEVANVGRTLRRGWDVQLNLQPVEGWRAWASYSRQRAEVVVADAAAPGTEGNWIENVPGWLASAGVEWQATDRLALSAWGNGQGDYHLDRTNTLGTYGGYAVANASLTWAATDDDELTLQVKNLTDRFYVYAWADSGIGGFAPGDGRGWYLTWRRAF